MKDYKRMYTSNSTARNGQFLSKEPNRVFSYSATKGKVYVTTYKPERTYKALYGVIQRPVIFSDGLGVQNIKYLLSIPVLSSILLLMSWVVFDLSTVFSWNNYYFDVITRFTFYFLAILAGFFILLLGSFLLFLFPLFLLAGWGIFQELSFGSSLNVLCLVLTIGATLGYSVSVVALQRKLYPLSPRSRRKRYTTK